MILTIDPNGLWRRKRFEFCNALEDVVDRDDPKAWEELEKLGVKRVDGARTPGVEHEQSRAMTGFWNTLSAEQKAAVLAYNGPENIGVKRVDEAVKTEESRDFPGKRVVF